jgi:hypothetical protein
MDTGLIAVGAGSDAAAPLLRLTSLAPLIAALLGLDFDSPNGHLFVGLLED